MGLLAIELLGNVESDSEGKRPKGMIGTFVSQNVSVRSEYYTGVPFYGIKTLSP